MPSRSELKLGQVKRVSALNILELRRNLVRILFIHRSLADVERCLHELKKARFTVNSDVVMTPEQFAERLRSSIYDVVMAEYPSPNWQETQELYLLRQMKKDIPLIFLVSSMKRETVAKLILKGAADRIEMESIGHLPVAVHRAVAEGVLRGQRDRAERDLATSKKETALSAQADWRRFFSCVVLTVLFVCRRSILARPRSSPDGLRSNARCSS